MLPLVALLATSAGTHRAFLAERGSRFAPGRDPYWGCVLVLFVEGNSKTEGFPCFRLWLRVKGFVAISVCEACREGILYSLEGGPASR